MITNDLMISLICYIQNNCTKQQNGPNGCCLEPLAPKQEEKELNGIRDNTIFDSPLHLDLYSKILFYKKQPQSYD